MININRFTCVLWKGLGTGGQLPGLVAGPKGRSPAPSTASWEPGDPGADRRAGPEAVIPLKGGAIPAMQDLQGRLGAILPSG
jgi:hypothetical protein